MCQIIGPDPFFASTQPEKLRLPKIPRVRDSVSSEGSSMLDALELRRLLSVSFENGIVTVEGTKGADEIRVRITISPAGSSSIAVVNGEETRITSAFEPTPRKVVIHGG